MTITSPVLSELVVVITGDALTYLPQDVRFFQALRKMYESRPFKLVFLPEDSAFGQEKARRELVEALDSVTSEGFLDFLTSPPTIRWTRFSLPWGGGTFPPTYDFPPTRTLCQRPKSCRACSV